MDGWKPLELLTRKCALLGALLLVCLFCQTLMGQDAIIDTGTDAIFEKRIANLWDKYLQAKLAEDDRARDDAFSKIEEEGLVASAEIFELGSYLFVAEGLSDLEKGDLDNARHEFHNAVKLNPHNWPAYQGLGSIKKRESGQVMPFLNLSMKGMRSAFSFENAWYSLDFTFWTLTNLSRSLMALLMIFSLVICSKYIRQSFASTLNAFEERHVNEFYARLLAIGFLCLPLLLGFNLYLIGATYIVLFFPFFEVRERLAAGLVLLTPILLPILGFFADNATRARVDSGLKLHLSQFARGDISAQLNALEAQDDAGRYRHLNTLIMGLLQKSDGSMIDALDTFRQIPPSSPWHDHAIVNIGNISFQTRDFQDADEHYQKVSAGSVVYGLALYNRGIVKNKQGFHDEAEELRAGGIRADKNLAVRSVRIGSDFVLDAIPDDRDRLLGALGGTERINTDMLVKHFLPGLALALLALLLAILHMRSRNARLLAKSCDKCGRIFFPSDSPESEWCSQCVTLYIKKDDLPSEAKLRKHDEVQRHNKRRRQWVMISQLLLPGAKKILRGNAVSGLLTLFGWTLLLFFCIQPISQVGHLSMRFLEGTLLLTWVTYGVTAVYWLIFGLRPAWQED